MKGIPPDQVAARGAAIKAGIVSRGEVCLCVLVLAPISFGIEHPDGSFERIISQNMSLPTRRTRTLEFMQDERELLFSSQTLSDGYVSYSRGLSNEVLCGNEACGASAHDGHGLHEVISGLHR